jgi:hypothetical protein
MTATEIGRKTPIPLKTKQIARNAKNDPAQRQIARNSHRNAQPLTIGKQSKLRAIFTATEPVLRCRVAPLPFLGRAHAQQAQQIHPHRKPES